MHKHKVAINGFGRIGRAFLKLALTKKELEVVAINDLGELDNLAYLLKYDSAYGRYDKDVSVKTEDSKKHLVVGGHDILFIQEKDPTMLPWGALGVDIVVESTGIFDSFEKASVHLKAGAKKVVISAPAKDEDGPNGQTVLLGINEDNLSKCNISSNGSCTTNSVSPVMQVLVEKLGITKAFLNTTHSYTATQSLIDTAVKGGDWKRGRAAASNISPSHTGAAIATTRAITSLQGNFDGVSMRVPTLTGSLSCIVFSSPKQTSVEELNTLFKEAEKEDRWQGILKTTSDQIVSSDIVGDPYAAIVDLGLTKVIGGDLCAVFSWYDNEFGYTNTLVEHVIKAAKLL